VLTDKSLTNFEPVNKLERVTFNSVTPYLSLGVSVVCIGLDMISWDSYQHFTRYIGPHMVPGLAKAHKIRLLIDY